MQREVRQANPDRDSIWDIHFRVKIRGPSIQVEASRVHEVGTISKDEVSVFFCFEEEGIEAPSAKSNGDFPLNDHVPVMFYPFLDRFGRRPEANKLTYKALLSERDRCLPLETGRERDFRNVDQLLDKL